MAEKTISKVNYFLVGVGIGSVVAILYAPKSGKETRKYIAKKASEGNEYVQEKARELKAHAEEMVERGKKAMTETKGQIATAIDVGRETYNREKSKAHMG
jgi:gas vesicle protein